MTTRVRIQSDGTTSGTRVFNVETNEEIKNIQSLTINHVAGYPPTAEIVQVVLVDMARVVADAHLFRQVADAPTS